MNKKPRHSQIKKNLTKFAGRSTLKYKKKKFLKWKGHNKRNYLGILESTEDQEKKSKYT